ncbi:endonuclease/exonuclease/phosphatase family protein [Streptomyces sp. NPDC050560]|uniref:endonuclease/exonuclease/phosphatase family protein n=1 Tax=Streptomyces sp. NPDC050560 TaxID=3365630 RepID=UPI003792D50E
MIQRKYRTGEASRRAGLRRARGVLAVGAALALAGGAVQTAAAQDAASTGAKAGADKAASAAAAELTLKTMTFNACANTAPTTNVCINGQNTEKVASDLANRIQTLHPDTRVVFLQEVCYNDIVALRKKVSSDWNFRFTGIKDEGSGSSPTGTVAPRACAKSRGNFGISIGVKADASFAVHYYPEDHVPHARDKWKHWNVHQAAICADVASWNTRVCGTHLTPAPGGSSAAFHDAQAAQVKDLIGYGGSGPRVILGGDLNSATPVASKNSTVGPLYDAYTECDQANYGGARDGEGTFQGTDGTRGSKLDYIFASKDATTSCYVTDARVKSSDHVPVTATTTFPAS